MEKGGKASVAGNVDNDDDDRMKNAILKKKIVIPFESAALVVPDVANKNSTTEQDRVSKIAVAKRALFPGTQLSIRDDAQGVTKNIVVSSFILEGHRFCIEAITKGELLHSWGLPFGVATTDIAPGDYLINERMQKTLATREVVVIPNEQWKEFGFSTEETLSFGVAAGEKDQKAREDHGDDTRIIRLQPFVRDAKVNFTDIDVGADAPFVLKETAIGVQGSNKSRLLQNKKDNQEAEPEPTFLGYKRSPEIGAGTRNHVAVVSLTALTSAWVRSSVLTLSNEHSNAKTETFDGICAVTHTEGEGKSFYQEQNGTPSEQSLSLPENCEFVLRCTCGYLTHPNLGGAVVVSTGEERYVTKDAIIQYAAAHGIPLMSEEEQNQRNIVWFEIPDHHQQEEQQQQNAQILLGHNDAYNQLKEVLADVVAKARTCTRSPCSLKHLRIALQCGGSDSFSGVTGNPLAGAVTSRLLMQGASAVLAESPELIGAEQYILSNVASLDVAKAFVSTTERYKRHAGRHGQTAQGNPSGGNLFRGLYNIVIKSLGAARKKPPHVTLDEVLEYGQRMTGDSKYCFMDSPGNDLESIGGEVACGCNLIIFITGNGSITNFPFVPTIKIVTTSRRFEKLKNEMDVDAGELLVSTSKGYDEVLQALTDRMYSLVRNVINGVERSKGELAGHNQISIWRNWFHPREDQAAFSAAPTSKPPSQRESQYACLTPQPFMDSSSLQNMIAESSQIRDLREKIESWPRDQGAFLGVIIPTSLCASEVADMICQQFNQRRYKQLYWICPRHTEGCCVSGSPQWERQYVSLILSHCVHPHVAGAVFLEHGCERTHNDYFRDAMRLSPVLPPSQKRELEGRGSSSSFHIGFASVQAGGGIKKCWEVVENHFEQTLPSVASDGLGRQRDDDIGNLAERKIICRSPLISRQRRWTAAVIFPSLSSTNHKPGEENSQEQLFVSAAAALVFVLLEGAQCNVVIVSPLLADTVKRLYNVESEDVTPCSLPSQLYKSGPTANQQREEKQAPSSLFYLHEETSANTDWVESLSFLSVGVDCVILLHEPPSSLLSNPKGKGRKGYSATTTILRPSRPAWCIPGSILIPTLRFSLDTFSFPSEESQAEKEKGAKKIWIEGVLSEIQHFCSFFSKNVGVSAVTEGGEGGVKEKKEEKNSQIIPMEEVRKWYGPTVDFRVARGNTAVSL